MYILYMQWFKIQIYKYTNFVVSKEFPGEEEESYEYAHADYFKNFGD